MLLGVFEGAAARAFADGLGGLALFLNFLNPRLNCFRLVLGGGEPCARENQARGAVILAVGIMHIRRLHKNDLALRRHRLRMQQHILHLAPIGARIHRQRATDSAGNARKKL